MEEIAKITGVGQKHTCVPEELTAIHKHLSEIPLRLFRKRLYPEDILRIRSIAHLYVAIARFRTSRFHAHREYDVMLCHHIQPREHIMLESLFIQYKQVRGDHDDISILITLLDAQISPCHTRGCISAHTLHRDVLLVQFGQLLHHNILIILIGTYIYVFLRQYFSKQLEYRLQLSPSRTEEIDKLLRILVSTIGPKSSAFSASQYDTIVVFFHIHGSI